MSKLVTAIGDSGRVSPRAEPPRLLRGLAAPAVIALATTIVVLAWLVRATESAWMLLGVGRGLVPPEYYPASGFVIVLATTIGQAVGWAGGSGAAYHVMTLVGFARSFTTWRLAMSLVYLGLGTVPLFVFHALFGAPLLGLPREGLDEWLLARYPDAHWLLVRAHPLIDVSLLPLGLAFLALLWLTGEASKRSVAVRSAIALTLLGTSLAVALSLAIHSTVAHIKLIE